MNEEKYLQKTCVRWFRERYPGILIHHSPNGGKRNAIEAKSFKEMGTVAGFPDLFIVKQNIYYSGLFIELKSEKGKLTEKQKQMHEYLLMNGYQVEVVRNLDEFIKCVKNYFTFAY